MLWISATVALICEKIGKNPERTTKVKSFISETFYNWEGIKYQLEKDGWRKFEKNDPTVNVLYKKQMEFCPAYISRHNPSRKKRIILLMISNGEGWYYVAVKNYLYY